MSVRELFRLKLESAEVIPDCDVRTSLMRKVARREFVRFNPSRFNLYYLIGALMVGSIAAVILFSEEEKPVSLTNSDFTEPIESTLGVQPVDLPAGTIITKVSEKNTDTIKVTPAGETRSQKNSDSGNEPDSQKAQAEMKSIVPTGISGFYSRKGLFNESSEAASKLQGKNYAGEILFDVSALKGCVPLKIQFNSRVNSIDSCNWFFGDGGYSNKNNPEWIFDMEGEYKVVLNIYSGGKIHATSSTVITVFPVPQARFEISPEKAIIPDDEIRFFNYSANGMRFRWDFGDGNTSELFEPMHRYEKFNNYNIKLVVSSESGCSDSLMVMNAFSGSEYFINFPNAFMPNSGGSSGGLYSNKSDESGQVFHPTFSGVTDYQLRIFSKRGILMFESNDVNIGWDGYFKGQLANPGVYIWKVRGSFRNGEPFVKMGDLTLLKN
jgi:PKD repeat protein